MTERSEVPADVVGQLRSVCLGLPEAYEEQAWVGTRWRVRQRTFAHVLVLDRGWPPAYARATGIDGPACVLTFESSGAELEALSATGHPFFKPPWRPTVVGLLLDVHAWGLRPEPHRRPARWRSHGRPPTAWLSGTR